MRPAHLDGYRDHYRGQRTLAQRMGSLKRALRAVDGLDDAFSACLPGGGIARDRTAKVLSYTPGEFRRIMAAARHDGVQPT